MEDYLNEVRIPEDSSLEGKLLSDLEEATEGDVTVVGMVRGNRRRPAPSSLETLRAGDILIVEADSEALKELIDTTGLELVGSELDQEALQSDEVTILEAVVTTDSIMVGRTARTLYMRARHGVNLLAVSRQGTALRDRLGQLRLKAGDVLLLQGEVNAAQEALGTLGCLPLAERGLRIGQPRRVALAIGLFGLALASATTGLIPVQIAFVTCAVAMVMTGFLTLREAYGSIDWPVIVLLGAMIPVGMALEKTGGAALIANALLMATGQMAPLVTLTVLLIGIMFLSDLVNNAAAVVLMAPIAISVAQGLGVSADPLLMGVAIGSSAAFLTPIGHQSNTLVMGPGGYKFGDYWRMGLPLAVVIAAVAIPLIAWVWPF